MVMCTFRNFHDTLSVVFNPGTHCKFTIHLCSDCSSVRGQFPTAEDSGNAREEWEYGQEEEEEVGWRISSAGRILVPMYTCTWN